jgi:hypothetical protein
VTYDPPRIYYLRRHSHPMSPLSAGRLRWARAITSSGWKCNGGFTAPLLDPLKCPPSLKFAGFLLNWLEQCCALTFLPTFHRSCQGLSPAPNTVEINAGIVQAVKALNQRLGPPWISTPASSTCGTRETMATSSPRSPPTAVARRSGCSAKAV